MTQETDTSPKKSPCGRRPRTEPRTFGPLSQEVRSHIETEAAAFYLGRSPQTLRIWAMKDGRGLLRPIRIGTLLGWSVADIRRLLGEVAQ